ncbi:MAG: TadE/TadG family type IV pilus assembly protein [Phenylobacterium sp.]|jgi:Flp pilus assembly protein TadG|uniref:TadE/TadG family type IV pilus assembly protein n=1 Tax=Phenylobacterium sp. TaxID=1871053 RepID=UPI00391BFA2A
MLKRLVKDRGGASAVEFALVAPILILLYFGMVEVTQGLMANRRASHVATTIGDLIAQRGEWKTSEIEDVFNVSEALLRPQPVAALSIRVTSIETDAAGTPKVVWSQTRGTGEFSGALVGLPPALLLPSEALVRTDTIYSYKSPIQQVIPTPLTFRHTMYLRPRKGVAVVRN